MKPSLPMLNLTDAFLFLTHLNLPNKYSLKVQYIIHTSLKCFLHNSGKPAESPALKGLKFLVWRGRKRRKWQSKIYGIKDDGKHYQGRSGNAAGAGLWFYVQWATTSLFKQLPWGEDLKKVGKSATRMSGGRNSSQEGYQGSQWDHRRVSGGGKGWVGVEFRGGNMRPDGVGCCQLF